MTTNQIHAVMLDILSDLSRAMPAEPRYARLLDAVVKVFPCDAAALLKLQGSVLVPLAIRGLSSDTAGRQFVIDEQPRLARILLSREPVRFDADSELPDPYDGLVENMQHSLHVHDCMGVSLYVDDLPWGVLTLDALAPGVFDHIDATELRTFVRLAEASIRIADLIDGLQERAEREHQLAQAVSAEQGQIALIGNSPAMAALRAHIDLVANSDLAVLISGETGTGKELVARHLHAGSARAEFPLVYVNCAALPENLVESELFGHTQGAFSGASQARAGKFELANGGTLFLDEIGEMPLAMQPKLLRALQSGEVQRLGSDATHKVDVRVVAATNRNLSAEVAAGRFRADLYHRLSVYPIEVPPLRTRGNDVILLAGHFMEASRRRFGLHSIRLDKDARAALVAYDWPGNVRELEHLISRAVLRARATMLAQSAPHKHHSARSVLSLTLADLDLPVVQAAPDERTSLNDVTATLPVSQADVPLREATDQFQRELIVQALARHRGNQARCAAALGLDRGNFSRLLKRLHIRVQDIDTHLSKGDLP
jgi:anaerobic nitric oxide reductase transcription regulator